MPRPRSGGFRASTHLRVQADFDDDVLDQRRTTGRGSLLVQFVGRWHMLALDRIAAVEQDQCMQNLEEEQAGRVRGLAYLVLANPIGTPLLAHNRGGSGRGAWWGRMV